MVTGDNYVVAVSGLEALTTLDELPANMAKNAVRAINKTIERARAAAAREMITQVNFPARYLSGAEGRLSVTKKASAVDLEGIITGRHRPTSLARFAVAARKSRVPGARVEVQPGLAKFLPKAFFVNLRSGNTDTKNNLGLAIRLPAGQRPDKAYKPTPLGRGVWLLYGPSVDQIFDDVAQDISPDTAQFLEQEFFRLMGVDGLLN